MIKNFILNYSQKLAKFNQKIVGLIVYIKIKFDIKLNSLIAKIKRRQNG